ncbi:MAG: carbohydrate kinase [Clostridia bacterium]|nr:carbohydrate kinase [Clostridia bacterium]MBQ9040683.1 carbohydrate kinase [Clostridia bacterium]
MKRYDVVALGELLIDFTENGTSAQGNPVFEANPGGAPCNVLAMLRKLDRRCAFVGKVGNDMFGQQLKAVAEEAGIDMSGLRMDDTVHTTLAFVKTYEDGDRDFSFYRNPGADMMLTEDELPMDMIRDTRIFHFGTLSMTHEGVRQATRAAVLAAKQAGAIISFDPNLRPPLWDSLNEARAQMLWGLSQADVVKIADNEIEFLTDTSDYDKGARFLRERFPGIRLLNVTAGANGSYAFCGDRKTFVPSFLLGGTIETTGAGDTFCASVLDFVLAHGTDGLSKDDLKAMLRFANAAAYMVTTRRGAIRSMPQRQQVEAILKEH